MINKPKVGMNVYLNDYGMANIGGIRSREMYLQSQDMVVIDVSEESMTDDVDTYDITVNQPLLDTFFISNWDVELRKDSIIDD